MKKRAHALSIRVNEAGFSAEPFSSITIRTDEHLVSGHIFWIESFIQGCTNKNMHHVSNFVTTSSRKVAVWRTGALAFNARLGFDIAFEL